MSRRAPLPVVELRADERALFAEHDLDAGAVAVAPHLLQLASSAAARAARTDRAGERQLAREALAVLDGALRRVKRRGFPGVPLVILSAPTEADLAAAGIVNEMVLVQHSTVVMAARYLRREPAAAGWIDQLSLLVGSWIDAT